MIEAELRLEAAPPDRLDVGHPVRDHDGAFRDAVDVAEDVDRGLGHHGEAVCGVGDRPDRLPDRRRRLRQHRVQGHQGGLLELVEERRQVVLVGALDPVVAHPAAALPQAVEAELVLDAHDVGVRPVDGPGGRPVGHGAPLPDPPADLGPIGTHRVALVDRRDASAGRGVGLADRVDQIRGEGRDPAAPGWVGGYERDTHDLQGTVAVDPATSWR